MFLQRATGEQTGSLSVLLFLAFSCSIDVYPNKRHEKGRRCLQLFGDIEDDLKPERTDLSLEVLYKILYRRSSLSEEVISQACRNGKHTECSGSVPIASGSSECQCRCHTPGT